jgi:Domain of unknown function (DUF4394)
MPSIASTSTRLVLSAALSLLASLSLTALPARAQSGGQPVIGLLQGANMLVRFNTATPGSVSAPLAVTGLVAGDTLRAIDFRPANGLLYAIATDGSNAAVRTYTINPATGAATAVGSPVTLPTPGASWDINFNPTVDRIRIVNYQDENARLVPDTGALAGDDTNLSPAAAIVDAVAYTNPFAGATTTTLYALNQATNALATIGGINGTPSPNGGALIEIGPLGIAFAGSTTAFDIATNNAAFAALRPSGSGLSLYTINLASGAATLIGTIGDGTLGLDDIAIVDPGLVISPPSGTYSSRQAFDIVLLADPQGRTVAGGTATFNGISVTSFLTGCLRAGSAAGGVLSLRCPNVGGPVTGAGTHSFVVRLQLSDGTLVQRSVTWTVVAVTEP